MKAGVLIKLGMIKYFELTIDATKQKFSCTFTLKNTTARLIHIGADIPSNLSEACFIFGKLQT